MASTYFLAPITDPSDTNTTRQYLLFFLTYMFCIIYHADEDIDRRRLGTAVANTTIDPTILIGARIYDLLEPHYSLSVEMDAMGDHHVQVRVRACVWFAVFGSV